MHVIMGPEAVGWIQILINESLNGTELFLITGSQFCDISCGSTGPR